MRIFRVVASALAIFSLPITSLAEDVTYRRDIKPIFDARCASCHGSSSPEYPAFKEDKEQWIAKGQGPRMDTYSHLIYYTAWPDTGALMRRLDDGKPGNMHQYLGETAEERQKNLLLFKKWVGGWTLKKWAEITKEDMNAISVKY